MRHTLFTLLYIIGCSFAATAQDTLWLKPNNRYTVPKCVVIGDADSILFRNAQVRIYKDGDFQAQTYASLIPLSKNNADSISSSAFTFEFPGRAIWKPSTSDNNYNNDYTNPESQWSFKNSKESEHFIVYWDKKFGSNPNASSLPYYMRVDVDDLLQKAEQFYATNVNKLGMAVLGEDQSRLDEYKMIIHLLYDEGWTAVGSGYDDMIGALWVTPQTCHPVGSTIAHETGHCFQYMVATDYRKNGVSAYTQRGWRYGYGTNGSGGNAFWEQCAQWQSFQDYPSEVFGYHVDVFKANYHRHFCHEWMRYASYWLQYLWTEKHGDKAYGRIWRESRYPEDPLETYTRVFCDNSLDSMWTVYFDYATRLPNYQFAAIHQYLGTQYSMRNFSTKMFKNDDDSYQVAYASCPETSGINIIPMRGFTAGTEVTADFTGLNPGSALHSSDPGHAFLEDGGGQFEAVTTYNSAGKAENKGWRYGFVAVANDKTYVSEMQSAPEGRATFTIPANTLRLSFVVIGAPSKYNRHAWDETDRNDEQWPYKVKFTGCIPNNIN